MLVVMCVFGFLRCSVCLLCWVGLPWPGWWFWVNVTFWIDVCLVFLVRCLFGSLAVPVRCDCGRSRWAWCVCWRWVFGSVGSFVFLSQSVWVVLR